MRGNPSPKGDVLILRLGCPLGQGLELVVAHAGQEDLGQTVARDVLAGDAHAKDLHALPPVIFGVKTGRLAFLDTPQLLLTVPVVLPVVRHAQVAATGPIPVAEQDRQGAPSRREGGGRRITRCGAG